MESLRVVPLYLVFYQALPLSLVQIQADVLPILLLSH